MQSSASSPSSELTTTGRLAPRLEALWHPWRSAVANWAVFFAQDASKESGLFSRRWLPDTCPRAPLMFALTSSTSALTMYTSVLLSWRSRVISFSVTACYIVLTAFAR